MGTWVIPRYSKAKVDRAGRALAQEVLLDDEREEALEILNNWRAAHSFPLNTFQIGLRRRARKFFRNALVAQRLKRTPSTIEKLKRLPKMQLSRMQDIGGCRAVVNTVQQVRKIEESFRTSDIKHIAAGSKDYISQPKFSGYRGVHLIYRYRSDRKDTYNGLLIEIQLRSRLQHAWATAVEIVGTYLQQSLKASEGPEQWLDFFSLISGAFAELESTQGVPGVELRGRPLAERVVLEAERLDVATRLQAYGQALNIIEQKDVFKKAHYYLMVLRPEQDELKVLAYQRRDLETATAYYLQMEKALASEIGAEVVLVAAESVDSLRRLYPNYFLDTQIFLQAFWKIKDRL